jgi:membrane protease YdiL (CAAX protease family)
MRNERLRALLGFVWGLALFLAVARLLRYLLGATASGSPIISQIVLKSVLILVALAGWKLLGRPLPEMGWRRAEWWNRSYLVWFVVAAGSMTAGSFAGIFLGFRHPLAAQMSFLQIVLVIWVLSSVSEEIYARGLVQSWAATSDDGNSTTSPFEPAIVSSAFMFAAMHAPLLWSPIGVIGGVTIVLSTLGLGWACAALRARSHSLLPAIACHIIGNIGAVPGGILGVLVYILIYGRRP